MTTPAAGVRRSLLSLVVCAGLCWLAMPAWAADRPCVDADGNLTGASTDQGVEDTGSRDGENSTCDPEASAYGLHNIASGKQAAAFGFRSVASGDYSSAFGWANRATGYASSAFGLGNRAMGETSNAFGWNNTASGDQSTAFGFYGSATGRGSLVLGGLWNRNGDAAWTPDEATTAAGANSVALGAGDKAWDDSSVAVGVGSVAGSDDADPTTGRNSVAVGTWADIDADGVFDAGVDLLNSATGLYSSALGVANTASNRESNAVGVGNIANGAYANAYGVTNIASGPASSAFGENNRAQGDHSGAFGWSNTANGTFSGGFGYWNTSNGESSNAFGSRNVVTGDNSSAVGSLSRAEGARSTAIGYQAVAGSDDVVSFGHVANDLDFFGTAYGSDYNVRLLHVAAGTDDTDAVNLGQMQAADGWLGSNLAAWFGGGASNAGGVFSAPLYMIQGSGYTTVGDALAAINNVLDAMQARADLAVYYDDPSKSAVTLDGTGGGGGGGGGGAGGGTQVKNVADATDSTDAVNLGQVQAGDADTLADADAHADAGDATTLADANAHADAGDATTLADANAHADAGDATTLADANAHADAGDAATLADAKTHSDAGDAATLVSANAHADAGDAHTLATARTYTDQRSTSTLSAANAYTDARFAAWNQDFSDFRQDMEIRFAGVDARIDRQGAMGSAMSAAAMNTSGLPGTNRVGIGIGSTNGRKALAVGYQRLVAPNASISLGGAFSGSERSVSMGAGFSW